MSFEGPNKIGGFIQFRRVRSFVIWSFHFAGVTVHKEFKLYRATRMTFIRKFSWFKMHPYNLYTIRPTHNWRFSIRHVDTGNNPASAYWCWSGGWNQLTNIENTTEEFIQGEPNRPNYMPGTSFVQVSCRSTCGTMFSIGLSSGFVRKVRQI